MFLDILADFFAACPVLSGKTINVDYLSHQIGSVSLVLVSDKPVFRSYIDGGRVYQTVFKLIIREPFDHSYNFSSFYSSFAKWINDVNSPQELPVLHDGFSSESLSVLKSGQIKNSSSSYSEFEILCRFTYSI